MHETCKLFLPRLLYFLVPLAAWARAPGADVDRIKKRPEESCGCPPLVAKPEAACLGRSVPGSISGLLRLNVSTQDGLWCVKASGGATYVSWILGRGRPVTRLRRVWFEAASLSVLVITDGRPCACLRTV